MDRTTICIERCFGVLSTNATAILIRSAEDNKHDSDSDYRNENPHPDTAGLNLVVGHPAFSGKPRESRIVKRGHSPLDLLQIGHAFDTLTDFVMAQQFLDFFNVCRTLLSPGRDSRSQLVRRDNVALIQTFLRSSHQAGRHRKHHDKHDHEKTSEAFHQHTSKSRIAATISEKSRKPIPNSRKSQHKIPVSPDKSHWRIPMRDLLIPFVSMVGEVRKE
jgi:hypothetical protein